MKTLNTIGKLIRVIPFRPCYNLPLNDFYHVCQCFAVDHFNHMGAASIHAEHTVNGYLRRLVCDPQWLLLMWKNYNKGLLYPL